ncbi:hypothetical protein WJ07_12455 [Burkholderia vietnamiensis]|nr:hypothetical protein WJ07_12455 [Burkholderia vietnamiensis]
MTRVESIASTRVHAAMRTGARAAPRVKRKVWPDAKIPVVPAPEGTDGLIVLARTASVRSPRTVVDGDRDLLVREHLSDS